MSLLRQLGRFAVSGVANTAFGLSIIYMLLWLGVHFALANALGFAAGLVLSYFLNKTWTFQNSASFLSTFPKYCALFLVCYLANLAIVSVAIGKGGVNPYLAQLAGVLTYAAGMFIGGKLFVFRERREMVKESPAVGKGA